MIDYQGHLTKTQPDWESRWDNVQELINFASEVAANQTPRASTPRPEDGFSDEEWDVLEDVDWDPLDGNGLVEMDRRGQSNGKGKTVDKDDSHEYVFPDRDETLH